MKKYALIIDVAKCENCNNCFLACKDEYCGNDWPGYSNSQPLHGQRWMNISRRERGEFPMVDVAYLPKPCMHCDEAPCLHAAKSGAIKKRPDGIVLIDPVKAKGQKDLVKSCPYGAIWWNEEAQLPQKCTMCAHLLDDGWKQPRCAQACPTGALTFHRVAEEDLGAMITAENLKTLGGGEMKTSPRVYYKNLYRFKSCMIAGSVATGGEGATECVENALVTLSQDGTTIAETNSDDFGDFKFDGLTEGSGDYELVVATGDTSVSFSVRSLTKSVVLPTIWI